MTKILITAGLSCGLAFAAAIANAQQKAAAVDARRIDRAIAASWSKAPQDWKQRFVQDKTIQACTAARGKPAAAIAKGISARELATIKYPPDGRLMGDWKKGEALAQSGYGLRFTDTETGRPNGGNCYACHQLARQELSFGTVGPSLAGYGKIRKFRDADVKAVYEKIYNPHVALACSNMPRFGTNGVLTIEQIKDLVALLMDPESPVNQ